MTRIVVVEDEADIADAVVARQRSAGHGVDATGEVRIGQTRDT